MARNGDSVLLPSLEEIHSSVAIPQQQSRWRRFLAFSGPAFLISVGYMDPGNWATDLEAGSKFGYILLWVLLLSNLMALLLQTLSSRLGIVTGRDLAQACRENYPRPAAVTMWLLCEIAIAATDLAEVIGTIIALKLLFDLPYGWGLLIAAGDTFILLALQRRGIRLLELVTLLLIGVIAFSFLIEIFLSCHDWGALIRGFLPGLDLSSPTRLTGSLYVAIGMLGATVMPHNLYLHSALVQTRDFPQTLEGKRQACKYNLVDSLVALNGAFLVNAAILILSVATFYLHQQEVESLQEAHKLLGTIWSTSLASGLFAVALLASGQSSTMTGTLAGQVVMEGFVRLRLRPAFRRILTRSLAIVPALIVIALTGHQSMWVRSVEDPRVDQSLLDLVVLSQVVLSFQLPFAIVPLLQSTSDRRRMGEFATQGWLKALAWSCAAFVVALNAVLIYLVIARWADDLASSGGNPLWIYGTIIPLALALAAFLAWVSLYPYWRRREAVERPRSTPELFPVAYRRIGVAVEFEGADDAVLAQAAALARAHSAELVAVHVVEGPAADFHGAGAADQESRSDRRLMSELAEDLRRGGLNAQGVLGYGKPAEQLARIAQEKQFDLLVVGTHGHGFLADMALGQTVAPMLHNLPIPILVVPSRRSGVKGEKPRLGEGKAGTPPHLFGSG
jgi:manganese transport protein